MPVGLPLGLKEELKVCTDEIFQNHHHQFSNLLDQCFPVSPGSHYLDDFPVWDPAFKVAPCLRLGLFRGEDLVSCAAARISELRVSPTRRVRVGVIGAVATDSSFRGKGLASELVTQLVEWVRKQGGCLVFLWGSEYSMYERLGFDLCGEQARLELAYWSGQKIEQERVFEGWNSELFPLIRDRLSGFVLREEDRLWFESHRGVQWFYTGSYERPNAYVAVGRGIDLPHMVHEWGGDLQSIQTILHAIRDRDPVASILGSVSQLQKLGLPVEKSQKEYLCLARVLDPLPLLKSSLPQLPIEALRWGEDHWNVKVGSKDYSRLSEKQLAKMLLGPSDFPYSVPIWIWGLDAA